MKQILRSPKFIGISLAALALIVIPLTLIEVQSQQNLKQNAETILWYTNESASTICDANGGADINVSFTNVETPSSSTAMNIVATDQQTGKSVNLGSITGGKTKTGIIPTGKTSLNSGTVSFYMTWTDGHSGNDTATAQYSGISKCVTTPTPTPTTPPGTPTPTLPSQTPTPTICPTLQPVKNVHIICPNCQLTPSPTSPSPTASSSTKY